MNNPRRLFFVLFFVIFATHQSVSSAPTGPVEQLVDRFDRRVPDMLEKFNVPGVAVALVHEGVPTVFRGYGLADVFEK